MKYIMCSWVILVACGGSYVGATSGGMAITAGLGIFALNLPCYARVMCGLK